MKVHVRKMLIIAALMTIVLPWAAVGGCQEVPPAESPANAGQNEFESLFNPRMFLGLAARLNLSTTQKEKIRERILASETAAIRLMAELKIEEIQLAARVRRPEVPRRQVEAGIRRIGDLHSRLMLNLFHTLMDIRDMLTPAQRAKIPTLRPPSPPRVPAVSDP